MCGPHGLKFKKPIELRLPHKGNSGDGMTFSLKSSDSPVGESLTLFLCCFSSGYGLNAFYSLDASLVFEIPKGA